MKPVVSNGAAERRKWLPVSLSLMLLALLPVLAAATAQLNIVRTLDSIVVTGTTSSSAHEEILRTLSAELFADLDQRFDLVAGVPAPPGWSLVTEQTLRTLAMTRHGKASVSPAVLSLQGVYDDPAAWGQALTRLERTLLSDMLIVNEAVAYDDRLSFAELCQQQFSKAVASGEVRFALGSNVLSPASYPFLDALIEIAADCPGSRVAVTGHTDASGGETTNVQLSKSRAMAVTDYFVARGIRRERLLSNGLGSAQPLDSRNTPAARARNRRIEFRLEQN